MAIKLEWFDEEHTILLTTFEGNWTWDEIRLAHRQGSGMVSGLEHKVASIYDLTRSNPLPPRGALFQQRKLADVNLPLRGITVMVRPSRVMRVIMRVFWLFYPASAERYPFEFADTVAEAHAIITRHREEWA